MKFAYIKFTFISVLLLCLASFTLNSQAQKTKIMGKVTDAVTKEVIPFVNIYIKGTAIGARTDFNGQYSLEFTVGADSLTAAFLGYNTLAKPIVLHKFQTLDFEMTEDKYNLSEVVIHPTTNPAEILLKKIIANKEINSGEIYDSYQYNSYSKVEFDANNISEKLKDKGLLKPFSFVFNNIDTSTVNGKSYLPIFLTETISEIYYRKSPKAKKEVILASKVSGIKNKSIAQFVGNMYENVNIYNNYITIFEKNFVCPIANFGLAYYKYYLVDSATMDKKWCYKIMFKPRRKQELTFTGNFWVADTSFAIKKIDMRIASDANINFLNDLVTTQEFDDVDGKNWIITKDKLVADFNVIDKSKSNMGFYGTKTTSYRDYVFNAPKSEEFYKTPMNIKVDDSAEVKSEAYWAANRHDSLSKDEKSIYKMVDTIKTLKIFRLYWNILKTFMTGYYVAGDYEIGPYFNMFSFNAVEGIRLRVGGRTSNKFSTKVMIDAHVAYGTKDNIFKYGGGFLYMLNKNPRKTIGGLYKYDIEQLGESVNAFRSDDILASLLSRAPFDKLSMVREFKANYENEWFTGFSNTFTFDHRQYFPIGLTKFEFNSSNPGEVIQKKSLTTTEVGLNTHFAYNEKFIYGEFVRRHVSSTYPMLDFRYNYGIKNFINSNYEYHRFVLRVEHWFNVGTFGWFKYVVEGGRILGTLPYPLLKLHEGNETWIFDPLAFNMMNYYEFVSDKYVNFFFTHHFDGLFLNKIPLMRRLRWREVASFRGVIGSLSTVNRQYNVFPAGLYPITKPYYEASVGLENIFKVFTIDAVWRLSYLNHPNISKFNILGTMEIAF